MYQYFIQSGYLFIGESRNFQSKTPVKWKFRLYSDKLTPTACEKDILYTKLNTQDLSEAYYPNKHNILFRSILKVRDAPTTFASIQTAFSEPSVLIKLTLYNNGVELCRSEGRGIAAINNISLELTDEPPPVKNSKEDKKGGHNIVTHGNVPPKNRYILEASLLPQDDGRFAAVTLTQLDDRPNSRGSKNNSAQSKKKKGTNSAGMAGAGLGPNSTQNSENELFWTLRLITTDNASIIISKDTEKEDRYKAIKDSWEASAPGRIAKARDLRDNYLKLAETGIIMPITIPFKTRILKPWTILSPPCPLVRIRKRQPPKPKENDHGGKPLSERLQQVRPSTPMSLGRNPTTAAEITNESQAFNMESQIITDNSTEGVVVLDQEKLAELAKQRVANVKYHSDTHANEVKTRLSYKERRASNRGRIPEVFYLKQREVESWQKVDQSYRDEYRIRILMEIEESNAKLKAAIEAASKTADTAVESALEDTSDKKKKGGKK
jgi:hypothetical protein